MANKPVYEPYLDSERGWVKFCVACLEDHDVDKFPGRLTDKGPYYEPRCHLAKRRMAKKETRQGFRAKKDYAGREYNLNYYFSLTLDEYNTWLESQRGCCAICGIHEDDLERSLAVDHDHQRGEIRGLLCTSCNMGLGFFKDDPDRLYAAVAYLLRDPSLSPLTNI